MESGIGNAYEVVMNPANVGSGSLVVSPRRERVYQSCKQEEG